MATGTLGVNPGNNDWFWDGAMHQAWVMTSSSLGFTTGSGNLGRMISVTSFIAGFTAGSGGAVAWKNQVSVADLTTTTDSVAAGNQSTGGGGANHTVTGDVPFVGTDAWEFGAYVSTGVFVNTFDNSGQTFVKASAISNATGGTNASAYTGFTGQMRGTGTYFILETYVRRTAAWKKANLEPRRGAAYTTPQVFVRRTGAWPQVGELVRRKELDWKREIAAVVKYADGTWEKALLIWDYDRPRYIGSWCPDSPARIAYERAQDRAERPYELAA